MNNTASPTHTTEEAPASLPGPEQLTMTFPRLVTPRRPIAPFLKWLRQERYRQDLSENAVAKLMGIGPRNLYRWRHQAHIEEDAVERAGIALGHPYLLTELYGWD